MARPTEHELRTLLLDVRAWVLDVETAVARLLAHCGEGVTPSEPASPAPSLLRLIGRRVTRWA